jgi:death-on-curing protein
MVGVVYPTVDEIQYYNSIAIEMFRRSKRDQIKTISVSFIESAVEHAKRQTGGIYDKAARLLMELTLVHAFESGNKRTAFLTTKKFVILNNAKFNIVDTEDNVRVMIGIREKFYTLEEVKDWIEYGRIKAFIR